MLNYDHWVLEKGIKLMMDYDPWRASPWCQIVEADEVPF